MRLLAMLLKTSPKDASVQRSVRTCRRHARSCPHSRVPRNHGNIFRSQPVRDQLQQGLVRLAFFGWRRNPDFEAIA